ncbi:type II toxin-antitoxin system RelE/ParE family toxin [Inquilinus sp. NPDC058860]|uniref:type II toxin-antitoxin system RelE/ParE family toxin n=1 Tax=Inquilinus sp. NPDC058860 TaxID=3346652 RepID=UPI00368A8375
MIFAPQAKAQLLALHQRISEAASPAVAERYTTAIVQYCRSLSTFPERGTRRDDLRPGLRLLGFRRRVTIGLTLNDRVVTILGVFYGGQDVEAALQAEEP